jgi:hypothetical protein
MRNAPTARGPERFGVWLVRTSNGVSVFVLLLRVPRVR